ncbi:MAG: hypothetical protein KFF77_07025 [Bacteroidetes bacterium]|nr:hypothetical protein [Bacteroidota bacterium]
MRTFLKIPFLPVLLGVLLLAGCGGKDDGAATEEKGALDKLTEAAENMKTMAEEMSSDTYANREPQPPVSFRVLLTYLPEQIDDMKKENPRGETSTMGEWTYSSASADYKGPEGKSARVELLDYAYIGMLYAPVRMWLKMKIDRESTEGFERTTEVAGYPAYEKWDISSEHAEVTVLVGDRFIINIDTRKMPENMPREIAQTMRLEKLAMEKGQPPA